MHHALQLSMHLLISPSYSSHIALKDADTKCTLQVVIDNLSSLLMASLHSYLFVNVQIDSHTSLRMSK